jgi:hypothetical protein
MWNIDKIKEYIDNGIEENLHLDYKSSGSLGKTEGKKKEISKDVSAFANSAGGIIIYGVSEYDDKAKSHLPEKIDVINRIEFSKEWLEQVINSNISPRIRDINITPIQYGDIKDNEVIYIVEIPQSHTAHQAKDKKYYKRYNFESIAMEDYEIKDIINRSNKTDITITLEPDIEKDWFDKFIQNNGSFKIKTTIWANNKGNHVNRFLQIFIYGDAVAAEYIIDPPMPNGKEFQLDFSNAEERKITVNDNEFVIGTERIPIFPKTSRVIGKFEFLSDIIQKNIELRVQVSTEDGSKTILLKGKNIVDWI